MTPSRSAAAVVVVLGCAVWCLARGLRRAPTSVAAARAQMFGTAAGAAGSRLWAAAGGPAAGWVERRVGADLVMLGTTASAVVARLVVNGALVFGIVLAGVAGAQAAGVLPAAAVWLAVPCGAGVVAISLSWHDVGRRITRRRAAMRRAANEFVELVAVGLTTDQSVEEAVRFALDVGDSGEFAALRRAVASAPQRGVPVWDVLAELGALYGVQELVEFAASVERQAMHGVSIGSTVATMAVAMRAKALDELEREADRANANLSGPTIGFVVATLVFLAYPLATRIGEAFGG